MLIRLALSSSAEEKSGVDGVYGPIEGVWSGKLELSDVNTANIERYRSGSDASHTSDSRTVPLFGRRGRRGRQIGHDDRPHLSAQVRRSAGGTKRNKAMTLAANAQQKHKIK
jgi:hypothetical protein